jgi:glycosyltransferase involved in cell wall biosynthesis
MTIPLSIVISTRNRRDDVLVALESCLAQEYPNFEVILYDDASTDGTAEAVRTTFPEVRLFDCEQRRGYLVWRNRGFRDATGDFIISLDDDAYFTDVHTLTRVAEVIRRYPQAGAFALPFAEPRNLQEDRPAPPVPAGTQLRSYTGCAHAVRRELALRLGGYPEYLVHQGEERHLCLRMLEAGYPTLAADTPSIVHLYSPKRERERVDYYGYRNTLLFTGMVAPARYVLPRLIIDAVQLMKHHFAPTTAAKRLQAILAGLVMIWKHRHQRQPVHRETYAHFRRLPSHGPTAPGSLLSPVTRDVRQCTTC